MTQIDDIKKRYEKKRSTCPRIYEYFSGFFG